MTIETERLYLRPFLESDAADVFKQTGGKLFFRYEIALD